MAEKVDLGDEVYIASVHEAGPFGGREGVVRGHTKPSVTNCRVIGARKGRDTADLAWSVYFHDTGEQQWFAPYLVRLRRPSG